MEKRKYTRFKVQDNAYAALRGDSTRVGKIYDISLNGLGFKYFTEEITNDTYMDVDIFLSNKEFHLSGIPCIVVCNVEECTYSSYLITSCRCGLKFEPLNDKQMNKLRYFLDNYTTSVIVHKEHSTF